jgi:hypothetical protein
MNLMPYRRFLSESIKTNKDAIDEMRKISK